MAAERVSAKSYGVRYGRKLREKVGKISRLRRVSNVCPYCHYSKQLKRLAPGIWHCLKCNSKFTGRAYYVGRKLEGVEKIEARLAEPEPSGSEAEEGEAEEEKAEAV